MNTIGWCGAWVGGCGLGLLIVGSPQWSAGVEPLYGQGVFALAGLLILPLIMLWPNSRGRWAALLAVAALGGLGSALLTHPPATSQDLEYYNTPANTPRVLVIGEITGVPLLADRSQAFRLSAREIRLAGESVPRPAKGDVYVLAARYPMYEPGTLVALSGALTAPPRLSQFDYPAYLARQGIFSYMSFPKVTVIGRADAGILGALLSNQRQAVKGALQRGLPEPQAALAVGVVTGDRSGIPDSVQEAFRRSGTTHIIAISGQNIALITGVVWLLYGANPRRRMTISPFIASAAAIVIYTLFTGASSSVVRAAVMGIILLFAPIVRRRYDPIAALAVTATGMVILDPDVLADVGFQLSFAAMLGIALLASPLYSLASKLKVPPLVGLPIAVSVAAQAATAPLIALISGQFSLVALPAGLIADLALLPLMISGVVAGVAGALFAPLAVPLGLAAWPFAAWILWWAQLWASPPWAALDMSQLDPLWVVAYYSALAACAWLIYKSKREPLRPVHYLAAASSALSFLLWSTLATLTLG